ncbi:hypothetical protein ADK52_37105 [Streptomyces sp. WM6372]|uniref:transposase n=1 Tax=Streptomyces sp. WM6372 TaxID=1415555 RepID=UPI0006C100B3|nr:transposase [Streptomyces sp. WM6372]KOU14096.1 hypothetical protein ADK52_37105 [Streptomyces sp. WM6372]
MGGNTIRRCARAATPEELLGGRRQPRPSQLDPYKSHLDKRWAEGFTNAIQLHSELQALGYRGSYQIISDYPRPRRRRRIRVVGPWFVSARAEELPGLHSFATGLEKDWDAVVQGLTSQWSSGPVEGRVNHIKMVKRQMFGRAKLPLLRKRVLLTAAR